MAESMPRACAGILVALNAVLDAPRSADFAPLHKALTEALDRFAGPADALVGIANRVRAERRAAGQHFVDSPLYPYGVLGYLHARADQLKYDALRQEGPCNCAAVVQSGLLGQLDSSKFVLTNSNLEDILRSYEDYECPACGATWRRHDTSTEQYTSAQWERVALG